MINIRDKTCKQERCNKIPLYNLPNEKSGLYCSDHKKDDILDVNIAITIFLNNPTCLSNTLLNI